LGYPCKENKPSSPAAVPAAGTVVRTGKGRAVYGASSPVGYKEATLGPTDNLSFNYPNTGGFPGWD
jgi:hypothetical protein